MSDRLGRNYKAPRSKPHHTESIKGKNWLSIALGICISQKRIGKSTLMGRNRLLIAVEEIRSWCPRHLVFFNTRR